MVSNSWLYHYYSVQSKIQFGLPFEGPARVPTTPAYYHHHSPTLQPGISHGYPTHPHVSYGYHSPVGISPHQGSPSIIGHHNGNSMHHNNTGMSDYRTYSYRLDTQPVDYSQTPPDIRCSSANSTCSGSGSNSNNQTLPSRVRSPPVKRRVVNRLEPLYIPESLESPESTIEIPIQPNYSSENSHGQTVLLSTVIPTRSRLYSKAQPNDPPEFIEQWNPSPPWSETAQKVPDITHQELSPYLTTTPPTPTSAAPTPHGPAFSFDWMPEQFVPIMDCSSCMPCITQDGITVPMPVPVALQVPPHWPTDHRLLPLQSASERRSDDESNPDIRDHRRSH